MEEQKEIFIFTENNEQPEVETTVSETPTSVVEEDSISEISEPENAPIPEEQAPQEDVAPEEPIEEEPQAENSPEPIDAIALFNELSAKFDSKIANDAHKNSLFDKMYGELKDLRDDQFRKTIKPIFMDLIVMVDNLNKIAKRFADDVDPEELPNSYKRLKKEYLKVGEHIQDLMYNYGIESFESSEGGNFNSKQQQAKQTSNLPEKEDRIVLNTIYPGYLWDEHLLRKEGVHINMKNESDK